MACTYGLWPYYKINKEKSKHEVIDGYGGGSKMGVLNTRQMFKLVKTDHYIPALLSGLLGL